LLLVQFWPVLPAQRKFSHQWKIEGRVDDFADLLLFLFLLDIFVLKDRNNRIPLAPQQLIWVVWVLIVGIDVLTRHQQKQKPAAKSSYKPVSMPFVFHANHDFNIMKVMPQEQIPAHKAVTP
jgi:hypothetical protein